MLESAEPPPSPLANSNKEIPQFVRDVINTRFPIKLEELQFSLIGVEEIDVLFYHAAKPIKHVLSALRDIAAAQADALKACHFGEEMKAKYETTTAANGRTVRRRIYAEGVPSIEIALKSLKEALKHRANVPAGERNKWTPSWVPPVVESDLLEVGKDSLNFTKLVFCRFHTEDDDDEEINPNEDLKEACNAFELWWRLNSQMFKVMKQQREYVGFLMACAKTDQMRFMSTIKAGYGKEPTEALKNALDALKRNIEAFKEMKEQIALVMRHCSMDTAAVYKELNLWNKEWAKEEISEREKDTVESMITFMFETTRIVEWDKDKRMKAARKVLERMAPFYHDSASKQMDAIKRFELLNRIQSYPAVSRIVGIDGEEGKVLNGYYPNPMLKNIEFEDCILEELNEKYSSIREDISEALDKIAKLDVIVFNLLARTRYFTETGEPPKDLKEALVLIAQSLKKVNKNCKVHVFQALKGKDVDIELAAIVAPGTSILSSIKEFLGFRIQRVSLPKKYQELVDQMQAMMEETKSLANEINALHRKVALAYDGEDGIKSYTKSDSKHLGGCTRVILELKEHNTDKDLLKPAEKAAISNRKNLYQCLKEWKKQEKKTLQWYQNTLKKTIAENPSLFATHVDETPTEFLRTKLAPKQRGKIIDYVVASILLTEEAKKREALVKHIKATVEEEHLSLKEELSGEDRRDFVRWVCDMVELKFGSSAGLLEMTSAGGAPKVMQGGSITQERRGSMKAAASEEEPDSADEFYEDDDGGFERVLDTTINMTDEDKAKERRARHQEKLAELKAELKELEAKLQSPEYEVPKVTKEERAQMEMAVPSKQKEIEGQEQIIKNVEQEEQLVMQQAEAIAEFERVHKQEEADKAKRAMGMPVLASQQWEAFSQAFGEMGMDEYPNLLPTGFVKLDLEMIKIKGPFRLV